MAEDFASKPFMLEALRDVITGAAGHGELGLHLCYSDDKHRHFATPEDLSLCAEPAGALRDGVDVVHMSADREMGHRPDYYEPLQSLAAPRLALGVADYDGGPERTRELVDAALAGTEGREFEVATACGMVRIDELGAGAPSLEHLLALHAASAVPVR